MQKCYARKTFYTVFLTRKGLSPTKISYSTLDYIIIIASVRKSSPSLEFLTVQILKVTMNPSRIFAHNPLETVFFAFIEDLKIHTLIVFTFESNISAVQ